MTHTTVDYTDTEELGGALHMLRDPLDCENLGLSVVDAGPGWTGMEHDHADDGQEEVYLLVEGDATLVVEGEAVEMDPGDAVRVDPDATRRLAVGDEGSRLVIAGAP
ncbi:MAG: cupin domain-containing protein [Haloferacaceae archaeon]